MPPKRTRIRRRPPPSIAPGEPGQDKPSRPESPPPDGMDYRKFKKALRTPGDQPGEMEALGRIAKRRGVDEDEAREIAKRRTATGRATAGLKPPGDKSVKRAPAPMPKPMPGGKPRPRPEMPVGDKNTPTRKGRTIPPMSIPGSGKGPMRPGPKPPSFPGVPGKVRPMDKPAKRPKSKGNA